METFQAGGSVWERNSQVFLPLLTIYMHKNQSALDWLVVIGKPLGDLSEMSRP